jgi:hypothetical protein
MSPRIRIAHGFLTQSVERFPTTAGAIIKWLDLDIKHIGSESSINAFQFRNPGELEANKVVSEYLNISSC